MKKYRVFLILIIVIIATGCVGRKKPDDIKLIKNFLGRVSYALNQKDFVLLDSLYYGEKKEREGSVSKLKDDIKSLGKVRNLGFAGKRIEIYESEAFVKFNLVGDKVEEGRIKKFELPMEFSLRKKGDRWRVVGHRFLEAQK